MIELDKDRALQLLQSVNDLQQKFISGSHASQSIFNDLLTHFLSLTESEFGLVGRVVYNDREPYLHTLTVSDASNKQKLTRLYQKHQAAELEYYNLNPSISKQIITGNPLISNAPSEGDLLGCIPPGHPNLLNYLVYPLKSKGQVSGILLAINRLGGYHEEMVEFLQPFASTSTIIVEGLNDDSKQVLLREPSIPYPQAQAAKKQPLQQGHWEWNVQSKQLALADNILRKLGWTQEKLPASLPQLVKRFIHPEDQPVILQQFRSHLKSNEEFICHCRLLSKQQEYRWHKATVQLAHAPDGSLIRIKGTLRDTHRLKIDQEKNSRLFRETQNLNDQIRSNRLELRKNLEESRALRSQLRNNDQVFKNAISTFGDFLLRPYDYDKDAQKIQFDREANLRLLDERQKLNEQLSNLSEKLENNLRESGSLRKELEASEQLLKNAINSYHDVFIIFDADRRIKFINHNALDFLGMEEEDVIGKRDEEFLPEEITAIYLPTLKKAFHTREPQTLEASFPDSSGVKDVLIRYIPHLDEKGDVLELLAITFDITEQKKNQQEIIRTKEQYQYLFRSSPLPMWIYDLQTLRFMDVNDAAVLRYGWSREEFLQMTIQDIRTADEGERLSSFLSAKISSYSNSGIWMHLHKDGSRVATEITSHELIFNGRKARIVLAHDISDRLRAEEKLIESRANLKAIFDATTHSYFLLDKNYNILKYNTMAEHAVRITQNRELKEGDSMLNYFEGEQIVSFKEHVARALNGEKISLERKIQHNGASFWYNVQYLPVKDQLGIIYGVAFIFIDITQQKETELALKKTYQGVKNFRSALYHSALISVTDLRGKIIEVNDKFCEVSKYSKEELIGQTHKIINSGYHPKAFFREMWKTIAGGHSWRGDVRNQSKDGTYYWVDTYIHPIWDENQQLSHYLSVRYLITGRKEAEQEIRQYARRLDDILENITDGFFTIDRDWRFTRVNKVLEKTLKQSREDLIGMVIWDAFPEAVKLKFYTEYSKTLNEGIAVHFEEYFQPLDTWVEAHAYPADDGISVYFRDISQRKKSEAEIRKLSLVASKTDNTVIITNALRQIEWVNEGFTKLTGYRFDEVINRNPGHFLQGPETNKDTVERIRQKLRLKESLTEEIINYNKKGEKYWIKMDITPIVNDEGNIEKFIAIQSNITERKNAEIEKAQLLEELIRKNQSLEEYAFITSHNLRAPIAHILGLTSLFNEDDLTDPFNTTLIKQLGKASENLDSIIKDLTELLAIRKDVAKVKENLAMQKMLNGVVANLESQIEETNATIQYDLSGFQEIYAVEGFLRSILLNLLSNAIKYRHPNRHPEVEISTFLSESGEHLICVQDNGLGINLQKYGQKIFSLYSRFHSHVEGKGMGLHLVRTLAEAMGGKVEVYSKEGKGSTFTLILPAQNQ